MQSNRQSRQPEEEERLEKSGEPERLSLGGLDCLFEETIAQEPDSGLTISQAVHYYGLPAKEIKSKVKTGEIPGLKLARKKWRIYPLGLPNALSDLESDDSEVAIPFDIQESPLVLELKGKLQELEAKLEAAAYRNGYLEAKLDLAEGQIKLLSCQQRPQSWWAKLFSFHSG